MLHDAMFDVEDSRYQEAIVLLKRVLAEQPEMPVATMQYGIAQARLKNYAEALGPLQKAVKLQPDNGMGHYELGLALFETVIGSPLRRNSKRRWNGLRAGRMRISR